VAPSQLDPAREYGVHASGSALVHVTHDDGHGITERTKSDIPQKPSSSSKVEVMMIIRLADV
jgi:hypothetical protein